jgi:hypothetical protein
MLLARLEGGTAASLAEVIIDLERAGVGPTVVTRRHRAAAVMACAALPVMMVLVGLSRAPAAAAIRRDPQLDRIDLLLRELRRLTPVGQLPPGGPGQAGYAAGRALGTSLRSRIPNTTEDERRAFAIFIADAHADALADERTWAVFGQLSQGRASEYRALVGEARALAAAATAAERDQAFGGAVRLLNAVDRRARQRPSLWLSEAETIANLTALSLAVMGILSIIVSMLARGPLLFRILGYVLVARRQPAGRWHAVRRALIAWSPALIGFVAVLGARLASLPLAAVLAIEVSVLMLLIAGALVTIWRSRSLQDEVAGTWIVPR